MTKAHLALLTVGLVVGCARTEGYNVSEPQLGDSGLAAVLVADGLQNPLYVTAPPSDGRLFVVERAGRIRIIRTGEVSPVPFLDIADRVSTGGERGLLGLAFHPAYADNGWFFVNYSDPDGNTRIERYAVSADPDVADPASAVRLLQIDQPFGNHNGGMITFGPDGMLYVGMGDGGSANDPHGHGQNPQTLLGALLRIAVDGHTQPYGIPDDNPFVDRPEGRDEIWAIGLRNPWRFSFDRMGDHLLIADVGRSAWEEINAVSPAIGGLNYGWQEMEGRQCTGLGGCRADDFALPIVAYGHDQGCSIIGGYVYRGDDVPEIDGHYFYSDFCTGWLRSFRIGEGGAISEHTEWPVGNLGTIVSFGEDAFGELYIVSLGGRIHRLTRQP
jgi:glucose/arabinose dehydrogenase